MHKKYMAIANELAKEAFLKNEIPIGKLPIHGSKRMERGTTRMGQ